jgi:hypothetical protein
MVRAEWADCVSTILDFLAVHSCRNDEDELNQNS